MRTFAIVLCLCAFAQLGMASNSLSYSNEGNPFSSSGSYSSSFSDRYSSSFSDGFSSSASDDFSVEQRPYIPDTTTTTTEAPIVTTEFDMANYIDARSYELASSNEGEPQVYNIY